MEQAHVVLAAEKIGQIAGLPITNTLLVSWLVMGFLIILSFLATRKMALVPSGLQNVIELVIESVYNLGEDIAHSRVKTFFPIVMTFFLFILVGNWFGLFPGFGTVGFYEEVHGKRELVPIFRSINSDLNITLALALISAIATHFFAIKMLGIKDYALKWFSLNPILLFVGLLEMVSEFTKVVSLSFRLFGNIFAGEVVLTTVSKLAPLSAFFVPLPFYLLEVIVGVVQAAVFMILTLVFMAVLSEKHEG